MKKTLLTMLALSAFGCSSTTGETCTVQQTEDGPFLACPDGTGSPLPSMGGAASNGSNGDRGLDGSDGNDGSDGQDGINGSMGGQGPRGADGLDGLDGDDGAKGDQGDQGIQGEDGGFDATLLYNRTVTDTDETAHANCEMDDIVLEGWCTGAGDMIRSRTIAYSSGRTFGWQCIFSTHHVLSPTTANVLCYDKDEDHEHL